MPSATYWPDGKFPLGLEMTPDYERANVWAGYGPPEAIRPHDAAWHRSRGYVWTGSAWVFEIQMRNSQNYADAIVAEKEANRLAEIAAREARRFAKLEDAAMTYGPQPIDDEPELMAAE